MYDINFVEYQAKFMFQFQFQTQVVIINTAASQEDYFKFCPN